MQGATPPPPVDDIRFKCPTTTVLLNDDKKHGPVTINASDFDPELHTKCDADGNEVEEEEVKPKAKKADKKGANGTTERVQVTKKGKEEEEE
jgi:hypothetical protein